VSDPPPATERTARPPWLWLALGVALLAALGTWQVQRLSWKEAILARIDAAEKGPPLPFSLTPPDFARMRAEGSFLPGTVRYGIELRTTPEGSQLGSSVIAPLRLAEGGVVLVNRGWAPDDATVKVPAGPVSVVGYARPSEAPGWFTPADNVAQGRFYAPQPDHMAAALKLTNVAPFLLVALGTDMPGVYPQPAESLPRPPNDHLQYALTWYGLGVVLIVMFMVRFQPFRRPASAPPR
jgi:surfeit locus 1 family protein